MWCTKGVVRGIQLLVQDCQEDQRRGAEPRGELKCAPNERPQLSLILAGVGIQKDALIQRWVWRAIRGPSTTRGDEFGRTIGFILSDQCYYRRLQNLQLPKKGEGD